MTFDTLGNDRWSHLLKFCIYSGATTMLEVLVAFLRKKHLFNSFCAAVAHCAGNTTILLYSYTITLVVSKPGHFFDLEGPKSTSPLKYQAEAVHTRVRRTHARTGCFTNPDQGTLHEVYCFYYETLALNFFCVRRMENWAQ